MPGGAEVSERQQAVLVLRPECLCLVQGTADGFNTITGVVRSAIYEGDAVFVEAEVPAGVILKMRVPAAYAANVPSRGSPVVLGWRPDDAILVDAERA